MRADFSLEELPAQIAARQAEAEANAQHADYLRQIIRHREAASYDAAAQAARADASRLRARLKAGEPTLDERLS